MTTALDAPAARPPAETRTAAQQISWYMGVAWLLIWLTGVAEVFDALVPFPTYYPLIAIFLAYLALTRSSHLTALATRPIFLVWTMTAVIPILIYLSAPLGPHAYQSMKVRIITYSVVAGTGLLLMDRRGPEMARQAAMIALVISISFNLIEFSFGNILGVSEGRAGGFHKNPNASAGGIIVSLLLAVDFTRHSKKGFFMVSMAFLAIIVTFSRAGIVFGLFTVLAYLFLPQGRSSMSAAKRLGIVFGGSLILGLALAVGPELMSLDRDASSRISSILQADFSDESTLGRLYKLRMGIDQFVEHFWTGMGMGANEAYGLSLHNAFLYLGVEFGILGLILYLIPLATGVFKVVQFGWLAALNSSLLAGYLIYVSAFAHYVHADSHYAVAFGVLMVDGLIPRLPTRAAGPGTRTTYYTFQ